MTRLRIYNPDRLSEAPARVPRRSRRLRGGTRGWLLGAVVDLAALLVLGLACGAAFGQCYIDPATGQKVCPLKQQADWGQGNQNAGGLYVAPLERQVPWPDARVVKLRNYAPAQNGYCFLSGALVAGGAYVLSCSHGLEGVGDPVLVIFNDGVTTAVADVVAMEPPIFRGGADCAILKLRTAGGRAAFAIAADEPQLGEPLSLCGFTEAETFRAGNSRLTEVESDKVFTVAGGAHEGESGGPVTNARGEIVGVIHSADATRTACCRLAPIRRLLDRLFPGRPAVVIPRADPPPRLGYEPPVAPAPPSTTPAAQPPGQPSGPPQLAPAGNSNQGSGTNPQLPAPSPKPPSIVEVPPARIENPPVIAPPSIAPPAVPPLATTPSVYVLPPPPTSDHSPPTPSVLDGLGTKLVAGALATIGLPVGAVAIAAPIVWWLAKRGERKAAQRIKDKLKSQGGSAPSPAVPAGAEESFHIAESTHTSELLERDTREGEELLRLRQLEGRDAFQDAIRGGIVEHLLDQHAESRSDPQRAQYARDLQYELLKKFNTICPTKLKAGV